MARYDPEARAEAQTLFSLCGELFMLGIQINSGAVELPGWESLKRRVLLLFESLRNNAREANVPDADVQDATYALAAFLDEMIQYSEFGDKSQWSASPLQATIFGESRAGVRFFERLETVRRGSEGALRVYYACLSLGFMGELRFGREEEHAQLVSDLRRELFRRTPKQLSVNGARPDDRGFGGRHFRLLPLAGLALVATILILGVLYGLLSWSGTDAAELLRRMVRG